MKVLLVPNRSRADAVEGTRELSRWLKGEGVEVIVAPELSHGERGLPPAGEFDLVVSLGGDGTLLRAASIVGCAEVPILGLSYGHLGFLTGADSFDIKGTVSRAIAGELHSSRRATLSVDIAFEDAGPLYDLFCLNEMALSRGAMGDIIEFDIAVSGEPIDRLRSDGFVVSTATGSTGYALSAGGPIVTPSFTGMVCVPVAPHTIQARAFLTSPSDVVEIALSPERPVERIVFLDGRLAAEGAQATSITVRRGSGDIILLTEDGGEFYQAVSRAFYGQTGARSQTDARSRTGARSQTGTRGRQRPMDGRRP